MGSTHLLRKDTNHMVPRAVQDAGYTAVGLGVLALQQVQTRRRDVARKVHELKAMAAPLTRRLEDVPRFPGPIGAVIETGRARLAEALRP
jgi:hypothetical protein